MKLGFLSLPHEERRLYFAQAAARKNLSPVILEKDFWVCWLLGILFRSEFASSLVFKGGTSLSKVFGVIDRFSEDNGSTTYRTPFDLALDRRNAPDSLSRLAMRSRSVGNQTNILGKSDDPAYGISPAPHETDARSFRKALRRHGIISNEQSGTRSCQ